MIMSLREGMNLTSHEFIFCQDGRFTSKKHGTLILSEFTGSSAVFEGSELAVNPYDFRQCADAIKTALEMEADEQKRRWQNLYKVIHHNDAEYWVTTFIDRLSQVHEEQLARDRISIPRLSISALGEQYKKASRRLFFLDYEGTLASWGSPSSIILTSPQRVLDVLNDVLLDPKNVVYVMSARKPEELDNLFNRVPNLGLVAENGCFLKMFGEEEWSPMADPMQMDAWKQSVLGMLNYYQERTEGSWVEERHCSLIFHYANAEDVAAAARQAGECANHINGACEGQRVRAIPIEHAVLVESMDWSKKTAATHVLELMKGKAGQKKQVQLPDFLMVAGDDREDETIFRWANDLGSNKIIDSVMTVSVGSRNTQAMTTLTQGVTGK